MARKKQSKSLTSNNNEKPVLRPLQTQTMPSRDNDQERYGASLYGTENDYDVRNSRDYNQERYGASRYASTRNDSAEAPKDS